MCLGLTHDLIVPFPHLCGNRLTDGTQHAEILQIMLDVVVARSLEQAQSRWGDVELSYLLLIADIPVSGEIGICRSAFEHHGCNTEQERRVYDVCVPGDPAHITTAEETIAWVNVEDVLAGHRRSKQVSCSRVHNSLGLASRSRGVQ